MRKEITPPASTTVTIQDVASFKKDALYWANHFRTVCLLDSNAYPHDQYHSRDWVLAIDALAEITGGENAFEDLRKFQRESPAEIFGFFSYDLKNQTDKLTSHHPEQIGFPDLYFFRPRYLLELTGDKLTVNRNYPETFELLQHIEQVHIPPPGGTKPLQLQCRTTREKYLSNIHGIRQHIARGDFYELNYCTEFYNDHALIQPVEAFLKLNQHAAAPFSCFFKWHHRFLLCASPERFLKKKGTHILSQPMKGTIKKGSTPEENEFLKEQLRNDPKEIAENVMIVDLVRNDLSRTAREGSVKVEEQCAVYEFNAVNQMISTITAELREEVDAVSAIQNAFPMGSMTGAPKIEVMKNIEQYEDFKRGLYSGAAGYITPSGDFDLNVVIRSVLYNADSHYLSIRTGSAITADSEPVKEFSEVLLKAEALMKSVNGFIENNHRA